MIGIGRASPQRYGSIQEIIPLREAPGGGPLAYGTGQSGADAARNYANV